MKLMNPMNSINPAKEGGLIGYTISELTRSLQVLANQFASGVSFAGTTP